MTDLGYATRAIWHAMQAPGFAADVYLAEAAEHFTRAGRDDLAAEITGADWHEPPQLVADRVWNQMSEGEI